MSWTDAILPFVTGTGVLAAAYFAGRKVYDDITVRSFARRTFRAKLDAFKQRAALKSLMHIPADERGRMGLVVRPDGSIINTDTHARFDTQWRRVYVDPINERMDRMERLLLAQGTRGGAEAIPEMLPQPNVAQLPSRISLTEALGMHTPSLDSLLLGVTLDENGELVQIKRSIYDLMHLLSVGRTGAGKSSWMLAFLAQLAMCREEMEIILIDVHGAAFNVCQDWTRIRYPVARTNEQAKVVLGEFAAEIKRRVELFQEVPLADGLASYNANVEPERKLVPWVVVIDEGTRMMGDSSIARYVEDSVTGTRQYGGYVFMTGQSGNTTKIRSEIRSCFPTRLCYSTESAMIRAALGDTPDRELPDIPGRAWASLISRKDPYMIQSPYVRRDEFYRQIDHDGARYSMPESSEPDSPAEWTDEYMHAMWNGLPKKNQSELCRALWLDAGKDPDKVNGAPGGSWSRDVRNAALRAGLPIKTRK